MKINNETSKFVLSITDEAGIKKSFKLEGFVDSEFSDADYRLLEVGEIIQDGDEVLFEDGKTWFQVGNLTIGSIQHYLSRSVRRRI